VLKGTFLDAAKSKFVDLIKTENWVTSLKLEETHTRMSFSTTSVTDLIVSLKIVFHLLNAMYKVKKHHENLG